MLPRPGVFKKCLVYIIFSFLWFYQYETSLQFFQTLYFKACGLSRYIRDLGKSSWRPGPGLSLSLANTFQVLDTRLGSFSISQKKTLDPLGYHQLDMSGETDSCIDSTKKSLNIQV